MVAAHGGTVASAGALRHALLLQVALHDLGLARGHAASEAGGALSHGFALFGFILIKPT